MIRPIAATLLLVAGVIFITVAGLGVARLPDVFQRMHAATKAGGIGTSLVVLTLSVASQLLGRAAYMSGATLHGVDGKDQLAGVLDRANLPGEGAADGPAARDVV